MKSGIIKVTAAVLLIAGVMAVGNAYGHCEIPCGIYGDKTRIDLMREHCETIEKSMNEIVKLKGDPEKNANQLVRWVVNKENHANELQTIIYQYFMNQRVKPQEKDDSAAYKQYVEQITLLHGMLVEAMKCKQSTDDEHVKKLRGLINDFEKVYFTEEKK